MDPEKVGRGRNRSLRYVVSWDWQDTIGDSSRIFPD